ncbi:predicted protein [Naegleria gruberi]|uniref:Predicted protein n=1 Tax=Naegleria gruberi TaxID=5762 RepID=D2VB19_NAEGR|nr:uncharacterized protein NAEGRDRAFT_66057 [Naegleria gruberi]EFC46046.1 predicted protein [Naegleria gruberi]|eukprot:XP_002678790.1 predicted protein [Naegleria gruberi strain NEG-M]
MAITCCFSDKPINAWDKGDWLFAFILLMSVICPPLTVCYCFFCIPLNKKRIHEVMEDPSRSLWCSPETNPALHIFLSFLFTLLFWLPGVFHAWYVIFAVSVAVHGK